MFRSEHNHLYFSGNAGRDFLPVVAALHNLIHKQGYGNITLDFTETIRLDASFMLPLIATARSYRSENVSFDIKFPADTRLAGLMRNTNWVHIISPETYISRGAGSTHHLEVVQFTNSDELFIAVDRAMNVILQKAEGLDRRRIKALEWSLNEIADNVLNHAQSPYGGFLQVITHRQHKKVEFFVCDGGVSIPRSLMAGRQDLLGDVQALRAAIQEGVTRNNKTNQGNGLYGTFKCCEVSGGEFDITSGNVALAYNVRGLHVTKNIIPFHGTFIRACISYDFEELLERALVFKGKRYDPGHDFVEREYQSKSESILFKVGKELEAFGSRDAGKFAKTKVDNLMDKRRISIIFDFSGLNLISSSFADEVFGMLFVELGPVAFTRLCDFKNIDPTVRNLIDRAISQRISQQVRASP